MYEIISGGVTAAQGFSAGATCCGIKASSTKNDTAIIYSEAVCTAAAVYTKNRVQAAPFKSPENISAISRHRQSLSIPATRMRVHQMGFKMPIVSQPPAQSCSGYRKQMSSSVPQA